MMKMAYNRVARAIMQVEDPDRSEGQPIPQRNMNQAEIRVVQNLVLEMAQQSVAMKEVASGMVKLAESFDRVCMRLSDLTKEWQTAAPGKAG